MTLPSNYNLTLYRGDSFQRVLRFSLLDEYGIKGDPIDLTGAIPKAQIRSSETASTVIVELTLVVSDAVGGEIIMTLTPTQTATLPNSAKWDLQITHDDGTVRTYLAGSVNASGEVTRP